MKRIFTLIVVALIATAMPVEAQKIKRANEAISRASELMKDARYEEADKIIDSLLTINPNYSDALYLRSNAFWRMTTTRRHSTTAIVLLSITLARVDMTIVGYTIAVVISTL